MDLLKVRIVILNLMICCFASNCRNNSSKVHNIRTISEENAEPTSIKKNSTHKIRKDENKLAYSTKGHSFATFREDNSVSNTTDKNTTVTLTEKNNTPLSKEENIYGTAGNNVFRNSINRFSNTKSNRYNTDRKVDIVLDLEDIESYLLQNKTQHFLSTFESGYQREVITMQLKFCPYTSLCTFSFGLFPPYFPNIACCKDCSCDFPACMNNKTCCPDIVFNHINMFNSTEVNVQLPRYLVGQKLQKDCISLYMSDARVSAFGYSSCPLKTEAGLLKNCTREYNANDISALTDMIPVISNETHELYRNKYCAFCNGVFDSQIVTLQVRLFCMQNTQIATDKNILNAIFSDGSCDVEFLSEVSLDYCETGLSKCYVTGSFEKSVCSMYRSVIYVNGTAFQNVFCSLCNGMLPKEFKCSANIMNGRKSDFFPFSGLLKLNQIGSLGYTVRSADGCSENQLFDALSGSCRDMVCSKITVLRHGQCVDIYEELEKITYAAFLRLTPINWMSITDAYNVADDVIDHMRDYLKEGYLCGMQMLYRSNMTFQENELLAFQNSSLLYLEIRLQYHVRSFHDPYKVTEEILKFHDSEHVFRSKNSNRNITFKFEVRDNIPRKFDIISFLSTSAEFNEKNHASEDAKEFNLTFLLQNYLTSDNDDSAIFPHLRLNDGLGFCSVEKQELNILWLTLCPKVSISFADFPWVETEDGLTIRNGDYVLKSLEFYFQDENHIMLCEDQYRHYLTYILQFSPKKPFWVEAVVSIICSVLSIMALCCSFFIFCFISDLRQNIPGKNNMSLIFTLMCAQSLYLIGSFSRLEKNSIECIILGILIHYSWLLALFWMNICTFHMFRVLTRTKVISHSPGTKRLVIYHVYAQTMAVIFVSINIALSYSVYGNIGYSENACYISSQRMIMYTFGIPTGVIILSNFIMFIFVIVRIRRSSEVQKSVKNERNDIIIFAKLSTITGATWVFGFLYIWTNLTVMSYLFILMNASQGVFIMFAFVINKRVLGLFKGQVLSLTVNSSEDFHPTSKSYLDTTKS